MTDPGAAGPQVPHGRVPRRVAPVQVSPGRPATRRAARRRVLGRLVEKTQRGSLVWLTFEVPGWAGAEPGQFALLQTESSCCFLPRALSVSNQTGERVSFLVDPVGVGTRELCAVDPGEAVWVLGPLGRGFYLDEILAPVSSTPLLPAPVPPTPILPAAAPYAPVPSAPVPSEAASSSPLPSSPASSAPAVGSADAGAGASRPGRLVVVAGGVGAAPFPLFVSELARSPALLSFATELVVLLGFRDHAQAQGAAPVEAALSKVRGAGLASRLELVTEDGSHGPGQKVTDLLERELLPDDRVVVCGPPAMATAVWRICAERPGVRTWFSLEAGMACGVGSCHGCAVPLADGSYAHVCREGPVFTGETVFGGSGAPALERGSPA